MLLEVALFGISLVAFGLAVSLFATTRRPPGWRPGGYQPDHGPDSPRPPAGHSGVPYLHVCPGRHAPDRECPAPYAASWRCKAARGKGCSARTCGPECQQECSGRPAPEPTLHFHLVGLHDGDECPNPGNCADTKRRGP